jgi:ATP/maltotriose-dependent transcriptional regulator MalT
MVFIKSHRKKIINMSINKNTPPKNTEFKEENLNKVTNRELQILEKASTNHSNQEIATLLGIALSTVKRHRKNIYKKFDISDHPSVRNFLRWFSNHKKDK